MKKVLVLVLLFLFCSINSLGSPLIFKIKKEITTEGLIEIGTFDATRYRQIRIGIKAFGRYERPTVSKSVAEIELNAAKRDLERKRQLLEEGNISRSEYDLAADRMKTAQLNYDNAKENIYPSATVFGVESGEEIVSAVFDEKSINRSILIDTPPSKISVKVSGKGTYSLYVWGQ